MQQSFTDFELVVQDNCSGPETRHAVEKFSDSRLIYHRSDERLAMHANWEVALSKTSGEYVIFLGDDDGLLPYCLEKSAELIEDRDVELLAWAAHTYYWPDVPNAKRRNHLTMDMRSPSFWGEYFSSEKEALDRSSDDSLPPGVFCLDSRRMLQNWLEYREPRIYIPTYHNLVSRRVIDKVRTMAGGPYFFNPLPDFGTMIANLYVTREMHFYAAPLSMTGHADRSAGGTQTDLSSWNHHLTRFIEEAKATPRELLPKGFDLFIWTQTLLAGCYENVKNQMFPNDDGLRVNWERFLREAAGKVNGEPEPIRPACREWIRASAVRIGVDPDSIEFPHVEDWKRRIGTLTDARGHLQFFYPDCNQLGFKTIVDAVNFAAQFAPLMLYPTHIPEMPKPVKPPPPTMLDHLKRIFGQRLE